MTTESCATSMTAGSSFSWSMLRIDARFTSADKTERGAFKAPLSCRRPCYNLGQSIGDGHPRSSHINRGGSSAIHQHYIKLGYPQTAASPIREVFFFMATESKQIDGVVNDPENGGLKSGPCLIAGFHALSCTSPSYYNPYRGVNKNTLSVDMVRLSLTFKGDRGEWLSRKGAQLTDCDEMSAWTSKIRPGGWYELWSFALGGSSVALGIGFMEPSCKVNMHKGFIEFNPNKVAGDKRFHGLLKTLGTCVSKARLKRFDLAYDIPVSRYDCRLSKDRRMYKSVISNGITEYLGVKNTPAYVKVYDKAAELHLDTDKVQLTRIEMTCDGEWTADQLEEHWPQVHAWHSESGTKDYIRVIGIMLAEKAERNEDVETLINMLGRTSRPKVREYLRTPCVKLPDGAAALLLAEAKSWCARFE